MKDRSPNDLPIRAKIEMAEDIKEIIRCLHTGQRSKADLLIEDLKIRSVYLDAEIQQEVLMFAEQVQFQYDYDPWHKITDDVQKAADKLIEGLGFIPPGPQMKVF
ncbi:MAG: hypothetical protein JSS32_00210 [Verrucomicrobia bacterium]|nr:hypothetical protein [Verrucomicrobiota bacterium]